MSESYLHYAERKVKELNALGLTGTLRNSPTTRFYEEKQLGSFTTPRGRVRTEFNPPITVNNYYFGVSYKGKPVGVYMFHRDKCGVYGAFVNAKDPQLVEILMSFLTEDGIQLKGAKEALEKWYQEQEEKA